MSLCYAYRNYSCTLNSKFGREGFKNKFMFHFLLLLNSSFANLRKRTENCEYTSDDKKFTTYNIGESHMRYHLELK